MGGARRWARRSRGAALVTALLIVALATTVIALLFVRENVAVRSVENRLALSQTHWIERAALDWVKVILRADARAGVVDHLGEPWAVPVAETRLDETVTAGAQIGDASRSAVLAGEVIDAQSRLNLNGVAQNGLPAPAQLAALRRLLALLDLPETLADAVFARVRDSAPRLLDGHNVAPTRLPLLRVADLLSIPGFDANAVDRLAPFAIVLPRPTAVNLNTAPAEVLAAAIPTLDLVGARRFVAMRERTYFRQLSDASALLDDQPVLSPNMLSVGSAFFLVRGMVRFERVEATSETLLERQADRVDIVWQQRH